MSTQPLLQLECSVARNKTWHKSPNWEIVTFHGDQLSSPFRSYIHDLFCSYIHLRWPPIHLPCSKSHLHKSCRPGPPTAIPALAVLLAIMPTSLLLTIKCFYLASIFQNLIIPINTGKPGSVTSSSSISCGRQRTVLTRIVDDAATRPHLMALGIGTVLLRTWAAGGCSGTSPGMPFSELFDLFLHGWSLQF